VSTLVRDRSTYFTAGTVARTAVTTAGVVASLAGAANIGGWFLLADPTSAESARAPITVLEGMTVGLAFVVLAVTLPALADVTRLPRWALSLAAGACAFVAIDAWTFGTVVAHLARELPAAQYESLGQPTLLLVLLRLPLMIGGLAAFATLAVVGWRRNAIPRGASVLMALAGLACLPGDYPPVALFAGLALAWIARSARETDARPVASPPEGTAGDRPTPVGGRGV
jgi:hypothetical protein